MSHRTRYSGLQSRFGLPRNVVLTERVAGTPPGAEPWLALRDEHDGMLFDTLDALQAGVIDRRTFDREKARIMVARRKADSRFDRAVREGLRPKPAFKSRRRP